MLSNSLNPPQVKLSALNVVLSKSVVLVFDLKFNTFDSIIAELFINVFYTNKEPLTLSFLSIIIMPLSPLLFLKVFPTMKTFPL